MEAQAHEEAYDEIVRVVASLAEARGIRLVIRYASLTVVDDDPQAIVKVLNNQILHQHGIDLTETVLARVNSDSPANAVAPPASAAAEPIASAVDDHEAANRAFHECPVATLDLARIYSEDATFKQLNEILKSDVSAAEAKLTAKKAEIQSAVDKLAELPEGSEAHREKQAEITRERALMESHVNRQKALFAQQEAGVYYGVLRGVQNELQSLAATRRFSLVLRTANTVKAAGAKREIVAELNSQVIYQRGIDVTDAIIAARNAGLKR
jgi:Skp family chaperone for outer membrane proteins